MQCAFHSALYMAVLQRDVPKPWYVAGDVIAIRISKWLCFGETNRNTCALKVLHTIRFIHKGIYYTDSTKSF